MAIWFGERELQGPLGYGIKPLTLAGFVIAAEAQGSEGLYADAVTAEAIRTELVAGLQEGEGHPLCLLTGAIDTGHPIEHLDEAATRPVSRIQQHGLTCRHAHGGKGIGWQKVETHGRGKTYCE
jgi:hypothetical protein